MVNEGKKKKSKLFTVVVAIFVTLDGGFIRLPILAYFHRFSFDSGAIWIGYRYNMAERM